MIRLAWIAALAGLLSAPGVHAQTAQASLSGEVRAEPGPLLEGARIFAQNESTGAVTTAVSNAQGQYLLPFLPGGLYRIRVQAVGHHPLERKQVELHVAQRAVLDFRLKPLLPDLQKQVAALDPGAPSRGAVDLIYGPDAEARLGVIDDRPPPMTDATSSTVSFVLDEQRLYELPLNGRNIYTLFVLLPGVTSDNATRRGLGFSVNGFRVSSANYLLDGVDNNNVLNASDVTALSPDAVREYRLATKNFSAEYGRGAFVANVITQTGGNGWHGGLFEFLIHEKLSANSFQDNAAGRPRPPFKEHQFGYMLGGPLRRDRVFLFTAAEALVARTSGSPQRYVLPSTSFISRVTGPVARSLFERFPVPAVPGARPLDADRVSVFLPTPVAIDTLAASARADIELRPDRDSMFLRFASFDQNFDNSAFSPYGGLSVPLVTAARNAAAGHIHRFKPSTVNEAKVGLNFGSNDFTPRAPGVPELVTRDALGQTVLPGNVDSGRDQHYADRLLHLVENISVLRVRHHLIGGGEYRRAWSSSVYAPGRIGRFLFTTLSDFAADRPSVLVTSVDRFSTDRYRAPDFTRRYGQADFAWFVQDNWRVSARLTLSLGLRYEHFGVPRNDEPSEDVNFYFGAGATAEQAVAAGMLRRAPENAGSLRGRLFAPDRNNLAPRFGFAYDLLGNSRAVVRGGYGIYYDRPFNLLWDAVRRNNFEAAVFDRETTPFAYALGAPAMPAGAPTAAPEPAYGVDAGMRTAYVQSWFAGIQHSITRDTLFEVNHAGSLGRKLPVRDIINRGRGNAALGEVQMISSQGASSYLSLETSFLRRFSRGLQLQVSYTFSHAIDNQGDPLVLPGFLERGFQREFDSRGDRGDAEFDQRQNLIVHGIWQVPAAARGGGAARALLGGWQVAGIAGFRSGFPFSVIALPRGFVDGIGPLVQPRADYLGGAAVSAGHRPVPGGRIYLDPSRFAQPGERLGNSGRNAFRGPGFWNTDLSLSREFRILPLGDTTRLQFRAEMFNALNHANLGNPEARLFANTFGEAQYGRRGFQSLLVGSSPLNEFPRRTQLVLRLSF